jgi:hypothetical protein
VAVVYDSGSQGAAAVRGRTAELAKAIDRGACEIARTESTLIAVGDHDGNWPRR